MRETYTTLTTTAQDLCRDNRELADPGLTSTSDFLGQEINKAVRFIKNYLDEYRVQGDAVTIKTVVGQQFYNYPPGLDFLRTVTWTVGGIAYDLEFVESEREWNKLNMIDFSGSTYPQYIFPRKNDFGLYPTPQTVDEDVVLNPHMTPKDMTADDVTGGTVAVTNGSATLVGTSTDFTANMVGRWIVIDGDWYKITEVDVGDQELTIFRTYYGSTASGLSYRIGESPDVPVILHELLPYKAAANWYVGHRRDTKNGQPLLNYFWTGDYNNPNREFLNVEGGLLGYLKRANKRGRETSQLVRRGKRLKGLYNERWSTRLE